MISSQSEAPLQCTSWVHLSYATALHLMITALLPVLFVEIESPLGTGKHLLIHVAVWPTFVEKPYINIIRAQSKGAPRLMQAACIRHFHASAAAVGLTQHWVRGTSKGSR